MAVAVAGRTPAIAASSGARPRRRAGSGAAGCGRPPPWCRPGAVARPGKPDELAPIARADAARAVGGRARRARRARREGARRAERYRALIATRGAARRSSRAGRRGARRAPGRAPDRSRAPARQDRARRAVHSPQVGILATSDGPRHRHRSRHHELVRGGARGRRADRHPQPGGRPDHAVDGVVERRRRRRRRRGEQAADGHQPAAHGVRRQAADRPQGARPRGPGARDAGCRTRSSPPRTAMPGSTSPARRARRRRSRRTSSRR